MTLLEHEQRRSHHAQRTHRKQVNRKKSKREREKRKAELAAQRKAILDALPAVLNDNMVLTIPEWRALNSLGVRNGARILASGTGPATTQLSPKRIGITVRANREWQASRERA